MAIRQILLHVGANRIRTNPNSHQMNSPKSNSAQSNSTQKYFPNENKANAIRPYQIHQKFNIVLLR